MDPRITSTRLYEEVNSVIKAGLDLEKWYNGEYPTELLAIAIAWHRLSNSIRNHTEDAVAKKTRKK